jgi:NADPH-dependent 2,4-dienoyl-CoA reductase/sulfur reductase-like enzyme
MVSVLTDSGNAFGPDPAAGLVTRPARPESTFTRREVLALAATALLPDPQASSKRLKKIIVAGAGIGGLSCAWELVRRGHDVSVLEASARTGGHVFTFREGLDDGLYADAGAEHFTQPGSARPHSFRGRVRGQSGLGDGGGHAIGQSGCGGD